MYRLLPKRRKIDNVWAYQIIKALKLRNQKDTDRYALKAVNNTDPKIESIFRVKGKSILSLFVYRPIESKAVEIMHIFSGFVKKLLYLWFDKEHKDEPFSIRGALKLVDSRLRYIKPPAFVKRKPRSLEKHLSYFKASSELKIFFFYYSLPIINWLIL